MKTWDDPTITKHDAYAMGRVDALSAIKHNERQPWGMTWDEPGKENLNSAYDRGALSVQHEIVKDKYPKAKVRKCVSGAWVVKAKRKVIGDPAVDSHDAWHNAAFGGLSQ